MLTNLSLKKNKILSIVIVGLLSQLFSCNNGYDVVIEQTDGTIYKFICKNDKDILNSTVYRFYKNVLKSKWNYVDGKKHGSVIDYHPNGTIEIITDYINDTVHGLNVIYNDSGKIIRRSFYINNKQILYESIMVDDDYTLSRRKVYVRFDDKTIWAGELYRNISEKYTKIDSINYRGMYVDVDIPDTVSKNEVFEIKLDMTLPVTVQNPVLITGEFNKKLECTDTVFYTRFDSVYAEYSFNYSSLISGNQYVLGRLMLPDSILINDIYFFKGYYVKPD